MATQIKFTHNEKEYTLEYTRKTVTEMEKRGFVLSETANKMVTNLPLLYEGAFLAHHKFEKKQVMDEIYERLPDKEALYETLIKMYSEPAEALLKDPDEGKIDWVARG